MQKHEELVKLLTDMGASFTGFADVGGKQDGSFPGLRYAVTVGVRLSDAIINEITDKPTYTYFHHYRTVNALLDQITLQGVLFIQKHGYNAAAVPASQTVNDAEDPYSGIFSHKIAAVLAGLGCIGKNNLFLHNDFGPRVRLATILTDMELPYAKQVQEIKPPQQSQTSQHSQASQKTAHPLQLPLAVQPLQPSNLSQAAQKGKMASCTSCNRCVNACPAMALTGKEWYEGIPRKEILDAKACSDYMNNNFKHIGRGSVCGICIKACPHAYLRG